MSTKEERIQRLKATVIERLSEKLEYLASLDIHEAELLAHRYLEETKRRLTITKMKLTPQNLGTILGPVFEEVADPNQPCAYPNCRGTRSNHPFRHPYRPKIL